MNEEDTHKLSHYDRETVLMALRQRIHSLWSIEMSARQKEMQTRYKLLFERLGGDYERSYEYEFLKGNNDIQQT